MQDVMPTLGISAFLVLDPSKVIRVYENSIGVCVERCLSV